MCRYQWSPDRPTFLANPSQNQPTPRKTHQFLLTPNPHPTTTYKLPSIISAPKSTFIHKSQLPTHQHLTNYWTKRPAQNRPKRAFSCPHLAKSTPKTPAPNSPSTVTTNPNPLPHHHIRKSPRPQGILIRPERTHSSVAEEHFAAITALVFGGAVASSRRRPR